MYLDDINFDVLFFFVFTKLDPAILKYQSLKL